MSEFLVPLDIANRALDHCGQDPISPSLGFTENSKKARLCGRVYGKVRRAELRRNPWRFAIKRACIRAIDDDTMLLQPSLWSAQTTYFVGCIVIDETNQPWISQIPDNLNFQPGQSTAWQQYFGPMTVSLYQSTVAYVSGELVYTANGDGTNRVFISLVSNNDDSPSVATDWDANTTYFKNQVIVDASIGYMSLIDLNTNNVPADTSQAAWDDAITYSIGDEVRGSDGVKYVSLINGNIGNNPVFDGGINWTNTGVLVAWTTSYVASSGSIKWREIGGAEFPFGVTLTTLNLIYPIGAGPSTQTATRNVYRLPASFLRNVSRDPKAGSTTALGAPTNLAYTDWLFEGQYIVTQQSDPIMLRFVADIVDVTLMDDMFCEGLAARIGYEICEPLTQSSDKLKMIASIYEQNMGDARTVNGIEIGPEQPPLDDYLAVRF